MWLFRSAEYQETRFRRQKSTRPDPWYTLLGLEGAAVSTSLDRRLRPRVAAVLWTSRQHEFLQFLLARCPLISSRCLRSLLEHISG